MGTMASVSVLKNAPSKRMGIVKSRENTWNEKSEERKAEKSFSEDGRYMFWCPMFFNFHVPFANDFDIHRNGDDCWFKPHED